MSTPMTPAAQELVTALQHMHGADHGLRQCLTLLRQSGEEVPDSLDDAISLLADALQALES